MNDSVGLLALSSIVDDPRVRRQCDLFAAHGWAVFAYGLPSSQIAAAATPSAYRGLVAARRLFDGIVARVDRSYALRRFWHSNPAYGDIYRRAREARPK